MVRLRGAAVSLALLIVCLIAYGPLLPSLGLYWDDWPSLWFLHFWGPEVFPKAFAIDRPAQGYLFVVTSAVVGESIIAWQVFGILTRWVLSWMFYGLLGLVWPQHKDKAVWATVLFLVYPGFTQQSIPITYGHQFLVYTAFLASLALMLLAQRTLSRRNYWMLTTAGLLLVMWSMFALEYFFGLELLRPALLALVWINAGGMAVRKDWKLLLRKVLAGWLPYAIAAGLFLAWRISRPTPRGNIVIFERLAAGPLAATAELAQTILQDLFAAAVLAWARTAALLNPEGVKSSVLLAYWLVVLAAIAVTLWLLLKAGPAPTPPDDGSGQGEKRAWAPQAILLGLVALAVGGWPVWVTDLRLELAFPWDRFTLPLIPGSVLLLAGLVDLLPVRRPPKVALLAVLVGLAAGAHLFIALDYRRDWAAQKDFFWQLAWRAPAIERGTLLLTAASPVTYSSDNSLSAPVNWIYANPLETTLMPYMMYALDARLGDQLPALEPGQSVEQEYRATQFQGNTSRALVLFYDPPRCLKVLDPRIDEALPNKPDFIAAALPLSHPEVIHPGRPDVATLERLFGPEPAHGWCYDYQQAELAAQQSNWPRVAELAASALEARPDLGREQAYELLPFIQGYAYSGDWPAALELSRRSASLFPGKMPAILCDLWQGISVQSSPQPAEAAALAQAQKDWSCSAP